jgi:hypothetical protein
MRTEAIPAFSLIEFYPQQKGGEPKPAAFL